VRELLQRGDFRSGAEEKQPHRQRHEMDQGAFALWHQFGGSQQGGAARFSCVKGSKPANLTAVEAITQGGEKVATFACGSHALHEDAHLSVAAIKAARIELEQDGRSAIDDLSRVLHNFIFQAAPAQDADRAAV
jgi:hypothetical protein